MFLVQIETLISEFLEVNFRREPDKMRMFKTNSDKDDVLVCSLSLVWQPMNGSFNMMDRVQLKSC